MTPTPTTVAFGYNVKIYNCSGSTCISVAGFDLFEVNQVLTVGKYYHIEPGGTPYSIEVQSTGSLGGTVETILAGPFDTCGEGCQV